MEATHLATDRQYWRTCLRLSQQASVSPQQQGEEKKKNVLLCFEFGGWQTERVFGHGL